MLKTRAQVYNELHGVQVWCMGDPIPKDRDDIPDFRVDEHIGNGEHYHLIHTNSQYRMEQRIRDMEDQLEPPHFPWREVQTLLGTRYQEWEETPKQLPPERVYHGRMRDLKDELDQVRNQMLHIQKEINEHVDASKKAAKTKKTYAVK